MPASLDCFSLTVSAVDGELQVTAAALPGLWPSMNSRLLGAGAVPLSVPCEAHGIVAASYRFSMSGSVCPEGFELDVFMRKLFVGFADG